MASVPVGNVQYRTKNLELMGFTGQVLEGIGRSSETETVVDRDRGYSTSTTYNWVSFTVRDAEGGENALTLERSVAPVREGDTVTLFWAKVGQKESGWLAVYNHEMSVLKYLAKTRNDLAGPFGYNMLIIAAVFAGVFGVMGLLTGTGFGWKAIIFCVASFAWIILRRKKLTGAVDAAIAKLRADVNLAPPAAA